MRIAMWSGPRNLSTAMMYSFASRSDFAVWDEPFYAAYLKETGIDHPFAEEVIAHHESNAGAVESLCLDTIPDGNPHFYMKHMPHHMIDGFSLDWAAQCTNVHLIRHPARVVASYGEKRSEMTLADIGFERQVQIFDQLGGLVIDSADIRKKPDQLLRVLCDAIELPFDPSMLSWNPGPKPYDGIWAKHWYNAVRQSTGFAGPEGPMPELTRPQSEIVEAALPAYQKMADQKLSF